VQLYQEAQLGPLEELFDVNSPYPEGINQLALRISTYEYPLGALLAIYFLSATGHTIHQVFQMSNEPNPSLECLFYTDITIRLPDDMGM